MKKLLIISLLLLTCTIIFAQDKEPSAWNFKFESQSQTPTTFNTNFFSKDKLLFGFQWAASKLMNDSLKNNCFASHNYNDYLNTSAQLLYNITAPTWLNKGSYHPGFWYAPFMTYEPTLPLSSSGDNFGQILRPDDESNPIFGFKNRRVEPSTNPTEINYSRMVLIKSLASSSDKIVLNDIYPQPRFKTLTQDQFIRSGMTDKYLGKRWYLTLNLRRLNPIAEPEVDDEIVLKLKVKYWLSNNTTAYNIVFDSIPMQGLSNVESLNFKENRGYAQKLELVSTNTEEFLIRRNMIPTDITYPDRTISASFKCSEDDEILYTNPMFTESHEANKIDSIDIEVEYYGHTDVAIDYIRIESINAHFLLRGRVDEIVPEDPNDINRRGRIDLPTDPDFPLTNEQPNDITYIIQSALDDMLTKSNNWVNGKLYRFYFQDTESDKFYWWGPLRYANLISNGMFIPRDVHTFPEIYKYYTKSTVRWIGTVYSVSDVLMPAPYLRNGKQDFSTLKMKFGFIGNNYYNGPIQFPDSTNSNYETTLFGDADNFNQKNNDDYYFSTLINHSKTKGLQAAWEGSLYEKYYNKFTKVHQLLYSDLPWNDYFLLYSYQIDSSASLFGVKDYQVVNEYYRAKTAEELRLVFWSSIIRGAKGFYFDGDENYNFPNIRVGQMGIGDSLPLPGNDIYSNYVGSDFIDNYNTWNCLGFIKPTDLQLIHSSMQVQNDRIYIGTKSIRTELFKMNQVIRKNNDFLMDLRLAANYSKGFRLWGNQDTLEYGTNNILAKFVNLYDIKTKKLWNLTTDSPQESYESFDSSFFDITLLRPSSDPDLTGNTFVIGLQNRRTDPLIKFTDKYNNNNSYMKFLSAAEFDLLTQNGGQDPDFPANYYSATEWQDYYYKKAGNREITIPFNYQDQNPSNSNQYCLLHVEELLAEDDPGTSAEWWRQERWKNRIDTIVGMDSDLAIKFQPGEGKIFKVSIIRPQTLEGKLDFSNQCKMVSHPVLNSSGIETNEIMYHICYQKKVPNVVSGAVEKVFYASSQPIHKDSENENIVWNTPIDISTDIESTIAPLNQANLPPELKSNHFDCVHPSLIARKDGNNLKVYVVFLLKTDLFTTCIFPPCETFFLCTDLKNPIVEAIIPYTNATAGAADKRVIVPRVFLSANELINQNDTFGTPVVSAGENGNFYAWSDAHCGIGTNFKSSSSTLFTTPNHYIKFAQNNNYFEVFAKHPSFNFYNNGSNMNALVWEEYVYFPPAIPPPSITSIYFQNSKIIYTNVYSTLIGVNHILPIMSANSDMINNNCLRLTTIEHSTKPVVISSWDVPNNELSPIYRNDQIFWESSNNNVSEIATIGLKILFTPDNYDASLSSEKRIKKYSMFDPLNQDLLYQPNLSYGDSKIFNKEINYPSSSAKKFNLLNFKAKYGSFNRIMNLPLTQHSLLSANERLTVRPPFMYVSEGNNSHLSKSWEYNMNSDFKMWQNRRVMESLNIMTEDNKQLIPNAKYFYRDNTDDLITSSSFVGFIDPIVRKFKYFIDLPKIDGNDIPINLPYEEYTDSVGYTGYREIEMDTLYSDWFHVDNVGTLEYKVIFADTVFADLFIQKESNGQLINIPRPGDFENELCFMVYFLVNGGNDNYRLALIKYDSLLNYEERLYFGEASVVDTIFAKTAIQDRIIDLANNSSYSSTDDFELIAYPNPATDVIYASALLPLEIIKENTNIELTYILANSIGTEIERTTASSGEIVNFKTHNLSSGAYFIKVEANTNTLNPLSKSKSIIISR